MLLPSTPQYAEAVVFRVFLRESRLLPSTELPLTVTREEYLGGVLDFTGELNRFAIARATARDTAAVGAPVIFCCVTSP